MITSKDVPSPIDLRTLEDAQAWAETALNKRPSRPSFFEAYVAQIREHARPVTTVLELGSGPGFLAERLLAAFDEITYTAFDFSAAMHELARTRLGQAAKRVHFVERSFKDESWTRDLGEFDCVVTHQAVHELRHKRYAARLHRQVAEVLSTGGLYLVCDHFHGDEGMSDENLFMTTEEQEAALIEGGFKAPMLVKTADSLAMYKVTQ